MNRLEGVGVGVDKNTRRIYVREQGRESHEVDCGMERGSEGDLQEIEVGSNSLKAVLVARYETESANNSI